MIRLTLIAAALAALVLPDLAAAKEPTRATISGAGLHKRLTMGGGNYTSTPIGRLTTDSGFFPAAYGQSPDPMLQGKPAGPLGPRYAIAWKVPSGGSVVFRIRQDLYPYARGGAVTFTKPGQPIFGTTTRGGWYRDPELKRTLVGLGLASTAPRGTSGGNWTLIGALAAAVAVLAVLLVLWRLRGRQAPLPASQA
jgi:hypothetical protein